MTDPSLTAEGLAISPGLEKQDHNEFTELCAVELRSSTAYELVVDSSSSEAWEAIVIEAGDGRWIKQIELRGGMRISELFRTFSENRVRILVRALKPRSNPLYLSGMRIREISDLRVF
jgi:hypothetical protein